MVTRRNAIVTGAAAATGALLLNRPAAASQADRGGLAWEKSYSGGPVDAGPSAPGQPGRDYTPSITPNGATLPFKVVDGVKIFHLQAEEVAHEFAPGLKAQCWGYNGRVHGPTLEAVEGDRVRVYVTNKLSAPTTIHWHGIYLPNGMDGVGGLTQRTIHPSETFKYERTFRQHGTFMYHSHHDGGVSGNSRRSWRRTSNRARSPEWLSSNVMHRCSPRAAAMLRANWIALERGLVAAASRNPFARQRSTHLSQGRPAGRRRSRALGHRDGEKPGDLGPRPVFSERDR